MRFHLPLSLVVVTIAAQAAPPIVIRNATVLTVTKGII